MCIGNIPMRGASQADIRNSCRFQGWSTKGIKRFNDLFDLVKADRGMNYAESFEELFKKFCASGGVNGKVQKLPTVSFETIEVCHELWSVEEETQQLRNQDNLYDENLSESFFNARCGEEQLDQQKDNESDEEEDAYGHLKNSASC